MVPEDQKLHKPLKISAVFPSNSFVTSLVLEGRMGITESLPLWAGDRENWWVWGHESPPSPAFPLFAVACLS